MIWTTAVYILKTCACTKQFCKYYKQLLDEVFVISGIIKVKVSIIRISQKLNVIIVIVLLYTFLKKIMTNTPLQGTWTDIVIGNHALHPQNLDKLVIC